MNDWFDNLVDECKAIITERMFNSNLEKITGYHELGLRVLEENNNFERSKIYGKEIMKRVSLSLKVGERTIEKAVQFAKLYPDVDTMLNDTTMGKNITWNKICNVYLPKHKELVEPEIQHYTIEQLASFIRSNIEFLAENAKFKKNGVELFIPKEKLPIDKSIE